MNGPVTAEDQKRIGIRPGGRHADAPLRLADILKWLEVASVTTRSENGSRSHWSHEINM